MVSSCSWLDHLGLVSSAHGLREGLVFSHLNNQRKDHNAHSNCAEDGRQAVKDETANRKVSEAEHNADYE